MKIFFIAILGPGEDDSVPNFRYIFGLLSSTVIKYLHHILGVTGSNLLARSNKSLGF